MKFALFLYLFLQGFSVFSQSSKSEIINPEHLSFREFELNAQRVAPSSINFPFEHIEIMDCRFDTTKFGFIPPYAELIHDKRTFFKKARFKNNKSIAKALEQYYNAYYQNSFTANGFHLLIVMKRFWVSGVDYSKAQPIELTYNDDASEFLYCKWEYYIGKNEQYLPVKRVDTIMNTTDELQQYVDEDFSERRLGKFKFLLKSLMERYDFTKGIENYDTRAKKSRDEINAYNAKRFDLAVLNDAAVIKGVYMNYSEFKNNRPAIAVYSEKKMHYSITKTERYLTDSAGNNINTYWGYSDGEDFRFGKYGNDKIFRVGNTFQFFVQAILISPQTATPVTTRNRFKVWIPYQIDMENGEIY